MMYIIRQSDKDKAANRKTYSDLDEDPKTYPWHVGEVSPRRALGAPFEDVTEIFADGHELEHVRKNYTNIPNVPSANSMVWKGPFAQFIYDHLPSLVNKDDALTKAAIVASGIGEW